MTKMEEHLVKSKLALRWNRPDLCYEVYSTTIGGPANFRWIKITKPIAQWYSKRFNLPMPTKD